MPPESGQSLKGVVGGGQMGSAGGDLEGCVMCCEDWGVGGAVRSALGGACFHAPPVWLRLNSVAAFFTFFCSPSEIKGLDLRSLLPRGFLQQLPGRPWVSASSEEGSFQTLEPQGDTP